MALGPPRPWGAWPWGPLPIRVLPWALGPLGPAQDPVASPKAKSHQNLKATRSQKPPESRAFHRKTNTENKKNTCSGKTRYPERKKKERGKRGEREGKETGKRREREGREKGKRGERET